jgi:quinol monooxygenase YgiN
MYARVTTSRKRPGQLDEYLRIYREEALPAFMEREGFVRAMVLVDREANEATSIIFVESIEALSAIHRDPRMKAAQVKLASGVAAEHPTRRVFEVAVDEAR